MIRFIILDMEQARDVEQGPQLSAEVETFLERNPLGRPPSELRSGSRGSSTSSAGSMRPTWRSSAGPRSTAAGDSARSTRLRSAEELGQARAPELINFIATEVVAPALMAFATEEQLRDG